MASRCRTGTELVMVAWKTIREEAIYSSQFLDRDMNGPLVMEVEAAGEGRVDGSTRRLVTTWQEDSRASVLRKALETHQDQSARPVWVHPQLDKLSKGCRIIDNVLFGQLTVRTAF